MNPIANGDVAEAVEHFDDSDTNETALTPEQVREFNAISEETDIEVKANKISDKIETLLAEVESGTAHLKSLLGEFGIEDGQVANFLQSERFDSAARGQLHSALEAFEKTTVDQVMQEAKACSGIPAKSTRPRARRNLV
ncbi:MAG: hypothetical protein AAFX06_06110 [Planctomycetota bacterium]